MNNTPIGGYFGQLPSKKPKQTASRRPAQEKAIGEVIGRQLLMLVGPAASVTDVHLGPDMGLATIRIDTLDDTQRTGVLAKLKKHEGELRAEIAKQLNLRKTPQLKFTAVGDASPVDSVLDIIRKREQELNKGNDAPADPIE